MTNSKSKGGISSKITGSLKTVFKEIWRMTPGKVALALLSVLIVLSIIAVTTMPPGFLIEWQSASYWEDNPIVVPPCWVEHFGYKAPKTTQLYSDKPSAEMFEQGSLTLNYTFSYTLDVGTPPQDVLVKVYAPLLCFSGVEGEENKVSPRVEVTIERPDGIVTTLWSKLLTYSGDIACGSSLTYKTTKEEMRLGVLVSQIVDKYVELPEDLDPTRLAAIKSTVISILTRELENRYQSIQAIFIVPEKIELKVKGIEQYFDPELYLNKTKSAKDTIMKATSIDEETKSTIIEYLDETIANLTWLYENKDTASYVDYVEVMNHVLNTLSTASDVIPITIETIGLKRELGNIVTSLRRTLDVITVTSELIQVDMSFKALQGNYRAIVDVTYVGLPTKPESYTSKVGFIVKGGCYGILGTAAKGVDIASIILYGTPIALLIGLVAAVASVMIGVIAGIVSGYYGGLVDEAIQRTVDIIGNIPFLPLMIIIGSVAQQTYKGSPETKPLFIIMLYVTILIIFSWGGLAITVRAMTLSIKEEPYIEAARAIGASNTRIIFKHIFPQVMMYAVAVLVFNVPGAILTEAGLSVLGLRHGWPTWGALLADARAELRYDIWWWIVPPGLMLSLTSLTFVLLGMAIERIVEPRLRTL